MQYKTVCICIFFGVYSLLATGCSIYLFPMDEKDKAISGYSYIPIDPFSVSSSQENGKQMPGKDVLNALPDIAVRVSVLEIKASGKVVFGQAGVGASGSRYQVTVDYINSDTISKDIIIMKTISDTRGNVYFVPPSTDWLAYTLDTLLDRRGQPVVGTALVYRSEDAVKIGTYATDPRTVRYHVFDKTELASDRVQGLISTAQNIPFAEDYTIPLYVGIGMRVVADIGEVKSNVDITGLGAIGASAEAGLLKGSLAVQTLGVSGEAISAALPIQSELNSTTAQNAIVAIGSAKALLYNEETVVTPRVVGMYLPFPADRKLVNAVLTSVASHPPKWSGTTD